MVNLILYTNETDDAIRPEKIPFKVIAQGIYDPAKRKREKKEREAKMMQEEVKTKAIDSGGKDYMASIPGLHGRPLQNLTELKLTVNPQKSTAERLETLRATVFKTYKTHPMTEAAFTPVMADNPEDQRLSEEAAKVAYDNGLRHSQRGARGDVRDELREEAKVVAQKLATEVFKARIYDKSGQQVATDQAKSKYLESVGADEPLIAVRQDDESVDGKTATDAAYQKWVNDLSNKVDAEVVGWAQNDVINSLRSAKVQNAWAYYQKNMKAGKKPSDGKMLQQAARSETEGVIAGVWECYKAAVEGMSGDALALKDVKTTSGTVVQGRTLLENGIIATLDQLIDDFATDPVLLVGKTKKTLKNQFLQEMKQPVLTAAARFECKESTEVPLQPPRTVLSNWVVSLELGCPARAPPKPAFRRSLPFARC